MSCFCCYGMNDNREPCLILDVQKTLQDHVWKLFTKDSLCRKIFLRRKNYIVHVPMNYFHFEPMSDPEYVDRTESGTNDESKIDHEKHKSDRIEIATEFVNDTNEGQTYKFMLQKQRKATLSVNIHKGFTVGGKANITLGLAKAAKANADVNFTFTVTKTENEQVEQTVTLETSSDIAVKGKSKCVSSVVLNERRINSNFYLWTRMSMPAGRAPVSIVRKSDNKVVWDGVSLSSLRPIFEPLELKDHIQVTTQPSPLPTKNYVVDFKTEGIIDGMRLTDQCIRLENFSLETSPGSNRP